MSSINGKPIENWIGENCPENGWLRAYWTEDGHGISLEDTGFGLRYEWEYKDGKRADGVSKGWFPNGNMKQVWNWKNDYGGVIINQLKKLGCSCDWSRNAFTMDENLSKSVLKVFVDLYKKKLIYKSKKLVNWDTVLKTAISDLEVDQREVNSKLYHIKYPIDKTDEFITIATTRPETMLGDTAIAVNPKDTRYKNLVGKFELQQISELHQIQLENL